MVKYSKKSGWGRKFLSVLSFILFVWTGFVVFFEAETQKAEAEFGIEEKTRSELGFVQGNSVLPIAQPYNPGPKTVRTIKVVITAYSSTPQETDDTPFITAAGTRVRDGIIANNMLKMGTKVRIPEFYGEKIFVVEDRMNPIKGDHRFDIWFPSRQKALNFGAKRTYIEILES